MPTATPIMDQPAALRQAADDLSARYADLLTGSYDCVDRIVLNAYANLCYSPGGFRTWWRRLHDGSDERLDDAHLMRMAGRFARRVRAWAQAQGIPVIDCKRGERKHRIAEEHLAAHPVERGVFLILVARAPATVWKVKRSRRGVIRDLTKRTTYVNHYSFHIIDPEWGHVTIKMSGHPPFGAQVMLNGHEHVAARARAAGIDFAKEGNCFTEIADPVALAQVADTLSEARTIGRLRGVCERWIGGCAAFGLDLEEQARSGFRYDYSVYQLEYSRNLLFRVGAVMERVFDTVVDRTRSRLDMPLLRTLFGARKRPHFDRAGGPPRLEAVIERPRYGLTWFSVHFGRLTLKAYTKGEHVLRVEAIVHNTKELGTGRVLERFPEIVARLAGMTERFCTALDCVDIGFLPDGTLDGLPAPSRLGAARVSGIDLDRPRMRDALAAVLALSAAPDGFTVAGFTAKVHALSGRTSADYSTRQGAYDLRKLRAKGLITKLGRARRYRTPPQSARTIAALLTLRDHVIGPILAGVRSPRLGRKPSHWTPVDRDYERLRIEMQTLFHDLGIAA